MEKVSESGKWLGNAIRTATLATALIAPQAMAHDVRTISQKTIEAMNQAIKEYSVFDPVIPHTERGKAQFKALCDGYRKANDGFANCVLVEVKNTIVGGQRMHENEQTEEQSLLGIIQRTTGKTAEILEPAIPNRDGTKRLLVIRAK